MPLRIVRQDITKIECDAIVNTTNELLIPGGHGVDDKIHRLCGEKLDKECEKIGGVELGKAVMTNAYNLPCRKIIHTVGPIWRGGKYDEKKYLISCYTECLKLARDSGLHSVAFPLISSGAYGFPKSQVLNLAVKTVSDFLLENEMDVYIAVYDKESFSISKKLFTNVLEYIVDEGFVPDEPVCVFKSELEIEPNCSILENDDSIFDGVFKCLSIPNEFSVDLEEYIKTVDTSFALKLMKLIDLKGMEDTDCYKKANVSRQTWHKIQNDANYKPSKNTIIQFAIALKLSLEETQALLGTVGFVLSKSIKFDLVISYFIEAKRYNIFEIEETLLKLDLSPLCNS